MRKINYSPIAIIFAYVIFTVSIILIIYKKRTQDIEEFSCQTQLSLDAYANHGTGNRLRTNASVTVFLTKNNGGFFSMTGTIEDGGMIYDLRRVANFAISQDTLLGMKKIIIKSVDIRPGDNTPEIIWNDNITPEKIGTPFYAKFKKINSNTIIINSLSLPFLMCVIQKN